MATSLQTGSIVAMIAKLSSVPKLHVDSSRPKRWDLHHWSTGLQAGSAQPPLWQSRDLVGGGLGAVATGLQTNSKVGIFSMLSSVPKLHVDRSSSETLRPPWLIYWAPSRINTAISVAKQTPCWWSPCTGGYGPPNWLHRWNIFYVIKRTRAACRQVQLRSDETSTTDLLDSKQAPGSHLCGKADTLLVEVLDRWPRASKLAPPLL